MKKILLFGAGLHASYCIDIIKLEAKYSIVGFVDSIKDIGTNIFGYPVLGRQDQLKALVEQHDIDGGIITIGDNWSRKYVVDQIRNQIADFTFYSAIHPSVIIADSSCLGLGSVFMAGCIISTNAEIGDFCFFATGAQLNHDSKMGDYASISAGSVTGGKVLIGSFAAITLGVTILDRITIGRNTVVGAGSLVVKDLPDNVLAYGTPARIIRTRFEGEKFLKSN
ncbi:MAG: acetyltransferase [Bacteroidota bacterium]